MARYILMEGGVPIWSAVRQVVAELDWQPDQRTSFPGQGGNVLLVAYNLPPAELSTDWYSTLGPALLEHHRRSTWT